MQTQRSFDPNERIPFTLTVPQYNVLIEQLYRSVPVIPVVMDMMMQVQNYSMTKPSPAAEAPSEADVILMPAHSAAE